MDDPSSLNEQLPADLQRLIAGAAWSEVEIGWSDTRVFRLADGRAPARYLKIAEAPLVLTPERNRLAWLQGRLPVPELLYFAEDADRQRQVMLMSEIRGLVAFDEHFKDRRKRIIDLLATGLRQIHAVDVTGCPFDRRIETLIAIAWDNIQAGRVDEREFVPSLQGHTAHSLFDAVLAARPTREDPVFSHGDYCLPNVLIDPDHVTLTGFVDWGNAGVADRYYDLVMVGRSLAYNFGPDWIPPFYQAYGLTAIDHARIAFVEMLDELVWPGIGRISG